LADECLRTEEWRLLEAERLTRFGLEGEEPEEEEPEEPDAVRPLEVLEKEIPARSNALCVSDLTDPQKSRTFRTAVNVPFFFLSSGFALTAGVSSAFIAFSRRSSDDHGRNPRRAASAVILATAPPGATVTSKNVGPSAGIVPSPVSYNVESLGTGSK
jgi:hypothetical protein